MKNGLLLLSAALLGLVGCAGAQGVPGQKGDTGAQGAQGIQGPKGDTGAQGVAGKDGKDGKDGVDGKDGAKGEKGETTYIVPEQILKYDANRKEFDAEGNEDAVVYGIVHQQYLGRMSATTNSVGRLTGLTLEEAYLPHTWAQIDGTVPGATKDEVPYVQMCTTDKKGVVGLVDFAKFIEIDGDLYQAVNVYANAHNANANKHPAIAAGDVVTGYATDAAAASNNKVAYTLPTFATADTAKEVLTIREKDGWIASSKSTCVVDKDGNNPAGWVKNVYEHLNYVKVSYSTADSWKISTPAAPSFLNINTVGADYYAAAAEGKFFIVSDKATYFRTEGAPLFGAAAANKGLLKSKNQYWAAGGLTWKGNVVAFLQHIFNYGFGGLESAFQNYQVSFDADGNLVSSLASKYFVVDVTDFSTASQQGIYVTTGCTWTDFVTYGALAADLYAEIALS